TGGSDAFWFLNSLSGIDAVVNIFYSTNTSTAYWETGTKQIFSEVPTLLGGVPAIRRETIDDNGDRIIRIRTLEPKSGYIFKVDLNKLEYLSIFDDMLSTLTFVLVESSALNETDDWKTYRNEENEYEVKYPSDWELILEPSNELFP
ncbi:MAG: hypothetical protein IID32_10255, partial [Planctomycetes bacterium]|nr:hypothetical protein [Planctomycetota bacterium]